MEVLEVCSCSSVGGYWILEEDERSWLRRSIGGDCTPEVLKALCLWKSVGGQGVLVDFATLEVGQMRKES